MPSQNVPAWRRQSEGHTVAVYFDRMHPRGDTGVCDGLQYQPRLSRSSGGSAKKPGNRGLIT